MTADPAVESPYTDAFEAATAQLRAGRKALEHGVPELAIRVLTAAHEGYLAAAPLAPDDAARADALGYAAAMLIDRAGVVDVEAAVQDCERASALFAEAGALDPTADHRVRAGDALHHAATRLETVDRRRAATLLNRAVALVEDALGADRTDVEGLQILDTILLVRIGLLVALGDPAVASAVEDGAAVADRLRELDAVDWNCACLYAVAGRTADALDAIERVVDAEGSPASELEADPDLAVLHREPRWQALVARARARGQ